MFVGFPDAKQCVGVWSQTEGLEGFPGSFQLQRGTCGTCSFLIPILLVPSSCLVQSYGSEEVRKKVRIFGGSLCRHPVSCWATSSTIPFFLFLEET